ncbi:hypothetical protein FRC12_006791 [Ceratobasidium sp. 428]|nr:hypothetical protein FRC12_006791 [Ceratobasidium sp. 428]
MVQAYGPLDSPDDVVPYLLRVAEALEAGNITLADATAELDDVLTSPHVADRTDDERAQMRDSYVRQYETRVARQQEGLRAGQPPDNAPAGAGGDPQAPPGAGPPHAAAQPAGAQPNGAQPAPGGNPGDRIPDAGALAHLGVQAGDLRDFLEWKRARGSGVDANGPVAKKQVVFPWSSLPTVDQDPDLHPNVRETRRRVLEYAEDLDGAKKDLLGVSGLPEVPDSVWRTILKNEYVDLDKIHSAYTSTVDTKRKAERIAEGVYLQTESDAPTKRITQSTDWLSVFRLYMRAATTVFPHRVREFETWESYVSRKFKLYKPPAHRGIIAAEYAARRSVFDSTSRTLFDVQLLEEMLAAWVSTDGVEYGSFPKATGAGTEGSGSGRPPKRPRKDPKETPCKNWNEGRCYYHNCRYGHICQVCRGDHAKSACKKTSN